VLCWGKLFRCNLERERDGKINMDIWNLTEKVCDGERLMKVPRTMVTAE
jgi:hypothetical protein